jgi:hypothetical protein
MGDLSKPIMSPVGVIYRAFHYSEAHALKSSEWAVKMFGGQTTAFDMIGPGKKGFYEAAVRIALPPDTQNVKPRKNPGDTSWMAEPQHAYVFYNDLEEPLALYFHQHEVIWKPRMKMCGYFTISLEQ